MTVNELMALSPKKVRNDNELMRLYIEFYKDAFFVEPNCAGCTFSRDWNKLKSKINGSKKTAIKIKNMGAYKLKRKYRSEILTYHEKKKPYRMYGRDITDAFAEKFLKNSKGEEKERREKMFEIIPKKEVKKKEPKKDKENKSEK